MAAASWALRYGLVFPGIAAKFKALIRKHPNWLLDCLGNTGRGALRNIYTCKYVEGLSPLVVHPLLGRPLSAACESLASATRWRMPKLVEIWRRMGFPSRTIDLREKKHFPAEVSPAR